jgi:ABC-type phosphate transport system auxiliary subunit
MQDIDTGEQIRGVIGSAILDGFDIAPDTPAVAQLTVALQELQAKYEQLQMDLKSFHDGKMRTRMTVRAADGTHPNLQAYLSER